MTESATVPLVRLCTRMICANKLTASVLLSMIASWLPAIVGEIAAILLLAKLKVLAKLVMAVVAALEVRPLAEATADRVL